MPIYVINLDRSTDRMTSFAAWNQHMPDIHRFSAVDGAALDRAELLRDRLIEPDVNYTNGALGCALSHRFFWEVAVSEGAAVTICEDDAVFHKEFLVVAPKLISTLPADWDLVMWGWNFDSILLYDLMPGISTCLAQFDQEQLRKSINQYQFASVEPYLVRLLRCFGTVCYSVSARGARRLLDFCFPLRPLFVSFPLISDAFPNNGIDIAMNAIYAELNAFAALPPLVVTANEHGTSTVLPQGGNP